jgi:hypothetical protein
MSRLCRRVYTKATLAGVNFQVCRCRILVNSLRVRDIGDNLIHTFFAAYLLESLFCLNNGSRRCLHYHKLLCGYDCFRFTRTQFEESTVSLTGARSPLISHTHCTGSGTISTNFLDD